MILFRYGISVNQNDRVMIVKLWILMLEVQHLKMGIWEVQHLGSACCGRVTEVSPVMDLEEKSERKVLHQK